MLNLPQTEHPSFKQPDNDNAKVWKYMDLAKFVWMLNNKKLFLSSVSSLLDPHEGSTPILNYEEMNSFRESHNRANNNSQIGNSDSISRLFRDFKNATFVSCWTMSNVESEAMWKLYCPNDQGIAIQSTYKKLALQIKDESMFIGAVSYIDYATEGINMGNMFDRFMHKRISFLHESEVRIVKILSKYLSSYINDVEYKNKEAPLGIEMDIDLIELVENIYVNPYSDKWFYDSTSIVIDSICPKLSSKINWSNMKSNPLF